MLIFNPILNTLPCRAGRNVIFSKKHKYLRLVEPSWRRAADAAHTYGMRCTHVFQLPHAARNIQLPCKPMQKRKQPQQKKHGK